LRPLNDFGGRFLIFINLYSDDAEVGQMCEPVVGNAGGSVAGHLCDKRREADAVRKTKTGNEVCR
jgi:hypothetical protein